MSEASKRSSVCPGFAPAQHIRVGAVYYLPGFGWLRVVDVEEPRVIVRDDFQRLYEVPSWAFHDSVVGDG